MLSAQLHTRYKVKYSVHLVIVTEKEIKGLSDVACFLPFSPASINFYLLPLPCPGTHHVPWMIREWGCQEYLPCFLKLDFMTM
jgi:hypothetical protein